MELAPLLVQQLISQARKAQQRAYAPYSQFPVGAAILSEDGRVFPGCNVENASFGLTVCAERNAMAAAILAGATPVAVAVVGVKPELLPCGACRQVLAEFNPQMLVVHIDSSGKPQIRSLAELLPRGFQLRQEET